MSKSNNNVEKVMVRIFRTKKSEIIFVVKNANAGFQYVVVQPELLPNGDIKSLDQYSPIIKGLRTSSYKEIERIYYFED